ncbi:putative cell division protein [Anopheles sinensis]|uniref:Putative cell division protein n=1 Tax=Anopheles sinensis TaxID=74873 RepID=A0A084WAB7_ANOSI|nr:putative cell division protein [Anopheles sinensis]
MTNAAHTASAKRNVVRFCQNGKSQEYRNILDPRGRKTEFYNVLLTLCTVNFPNCDVIACNPSPVLAEIACNCERHTRNTVDVANAAITESDFGMLVRAACRLRYLIDIFRFRHQQRM